jgi:hypothetical protein
VNTQSNPAGLCQIDILRWGPLRSTWCMMFEHMNQVVKFSALRNNFLNTLQFTGTRLAEMLAFNLFSKTHADFSKPVIFVQLEEMCSLGSSPIIDLLIVCQWLEPRLFCQDSNSPCFCVPMAAELWPCASAYTTPDDEGRVAVEDQNRQLFIPGRRSRTMLHRNLEVYCYHRELAPHRWSFIPSVGTSPSPLKPQGQCPHIQIDPSLCPGGGSTWWWTLRGTKYYPQSHGTLSGLRRLPPSSAPHLLSSHQLVLICSTQSV